MCVCVFFNHHHHLIAAEIIRATTGAGSGIGLAVRAKHCSSMRAAMARSTSDCIVDVKEGKQRGARFFLVSSRTSSAREHPHVSPRIGTRPAWSLRVQHAPVTLRGLEGEAAPFVEIRRRACCSCHSVQEAAVYPHRLRLRVITGFEVVGVSTIDVPFR